MLMNATTDNSRGKLLLFRIWKKNNIDSLEMRSVYPSEKDETQTKKTALKFLENCIRSHVISLEGLRLKKGPPEGSWNYPYDPRKLPHGGSEKFTSKFQVILSEFRI